MTPPSAGDVAAGAAMGAGSLVVSLMGAEAGVIAAAAASCVLGVPASAPSRGRWRAVAVYLASVVVTCHASGWLGAWLVNWAGPWASPHAVKAQAACAICTGLLLHLAIARAQGIVDKLLQRVGVPTP